MYTSATYWLFYSLVGVVLLFYVTFVTKNLKLLKFSFTNNGFFVPIVPFVGTAYLGLFTRDTLNALSAVNFMKNIFGFPCNAWMGFHYILINNDAEEINVIVNHPKCIDKPIPFYENFKPIAQNSLFLLSYDKWRLRRKHLLKSYRPKVLKTCQLTFYKQSCELLKEIKNQKVQENLFDVCNRYSFTNFFLTSVGLEEEKFDQKQMHEFGQILDKIQQLTASHIIDPITPMNIWLILFPNGRKVAQLLESSKLIVGNIIQQKRKQHADVQVYTENANELPLMDSMLSVNGKKMSENDIFDEMILFSGAATETTGNVMAFCITCLGMYLNNQETLYNEVMTVVGDNSISCNDLANFKYTEAVILETLRFFPTVPLVGRYLDADIDVGARILPKGTNYIISVFHLHRDSRYWDNPMKFDPSRFLPGKIEKIQPYSYIPFSGGSRDCIGKSQAMMLMKTTIANVVRNFTITSSVKSLEDIQLASSLTMKATHPLFCQFTPR